MRTAGTLNFGWRVLADAVSLAPDSVCIIQGRRTLTYRQFEERICRAGGVLRRLGVGPGDRVALLFPNDYRFLELLFGAMRVGAVAVPLNIRMSQEALAYVVADSGAKLLAAHGDLADRARDLVQRAGQDLPLLMAGGAAAKRYEDFLAAAQPTLDPEPVEEDSVCMQPYTSGSTGRPKGCLLTHGGQYWNADATRKVWYLDRHERALVAVPLYHKNAMICAVKPCLLAGASFVILPEFDPHAVLAAIEEHRCTYTTGVPAMYRMILAEDEVLRRTDLSSLDFVICGSAPVAPELWQQMTAALGVDVIEAYGLTEGGPQVLVNPRFGLKKRGSAGLPLPGGKIRIVDAETGSHDVAAEAVGELWVQNPGVARGYHGLPELTVEKMTADRWLRTGDLAWQDRDGYVYISGRKDDMIITGGENVYPKEVENLISRCPGVRDVSVVAVSHPVKDQVPVAFVVADPEATLTEDAVKTFTLEHGPGYAHPRRVWFVESLPLSGTGKVDRTVLTKEAEQRYNKTK